MLAHQCSDPHLHGNSSTMPWWCSSSSGWWSVAVPSYILVLLPLTPHPLYPHSPCTALHAEEGTIKHSYEDVLSVLPLFKSFHQWLECVCVSFKPHWWPTLHPSCAICSHNSLPVSFFAPRVLPCQGSAPFLCWSLCCSWLIQTTLRIITF